MKFLNLAAPLFLCDLNRNTLLSRWLNWFKVGDRSGSTSRTKKSSEADEYGLAPFDANKSMTKLTTWDLCNKMLKSRTSSHCWLVSKS
jgi:hypothetical protein